MYLFGVPTKIPAEAPTIYALCFVVPDLLGIGKVIFVPNLWRYAI